MENNQIKVGDVLKKLNLGYFGGGIKIEDAGSDEYHPKCELIFPTENDSQFNDLPITKWVNGLVELPFGINIPVGIIPELINCRKEFILIPTTKDGRMSSSIVYQNWSLAIPLDWDTWMAE